MMEEEENEKAKEQDKFSDEAILEKIAIAFLFFIYLFIFLKIMYF